MPFYKRTVRPCCVCRLQKEDGEVAVPGDRGGSSSILDALGNHGNPVWRAASFTCLEEVRCHTLANLLRQLSDLSRHAAGMFLEIEAETELLTRRSDDVRSRLHCLRNAVRTLDHSKMQCPVSSLDEESKWTVHYSAPWHQQENVFLPSTRPACVEDLHRQAKVNLKILLRDCDRLRNDGFRSSQYYSQGPVFSSRDLSDGSLANHQDSDQKSSLSSTEEDRCSTRLRCPLLEDCGINGQMHWSKTLPLPTPEEKMRQQAQCVPTDIIPINVTGENFDRHASIRRSLVNTDTVVRRTKKVKRRKTITGVPDNIQKELGTGELPSPSMSIPGQYSTLGRVGSVCSALRRSSTRDSSCQTEDLKIMPPSMRKIRAQKAHGLAAQMSNSSMGSISTISNSAGVIFDQRCHSLPRQCTRTCPQKEPSYTSAPNGMEDCIAGTLSHQTEAQKSPLRTIHKTDLRPYSINQEEKFKSSQGLLDPTSLSSPHGTRSVLLISNGLLSSSVEGISSTEVLEQCAIHMHSVSSYCTDKPFSSLEVSEGQHPPSLASVITSCHCDSAVSLSTGTLTETESQCSNPDGTKSSCGKDAPSESTCSYGSLQSCSPVTPDQWIYDSVQNNPPSSSCSTPINHMCPPKKADSCSLFFMDSDGYYTSRHLDSGLKSRSYSSINGADHTKDYTCECKDNQKQDDQISLCSNKSLSRSISLRKAKKPPLPPTRTDSLRRKAEKDSQPKVTDPQPDGCFLSETLIATLHESPQLSFHSNSTSSPAQSPSSNSDSPWVPCSQSQSSISDGSSMISPCNGNICSTTPLQSNNSNLSPNCSESLACNAETTELQVHSSEIQSTYAGGIPQDFPREEHHTDRKMLPPAHNGIRVEKTKMVLLPEKKNHLKCPSSCYPSQVNSLPSLKKTRSPAGLRPKPKVPERKSSLLSSVSASPIATSMSLGTPDSPKNLPVVHSNSPLLLPETTNSTQQSCITTAASLLSTTPDSSLISVHGHDSLPVMLPTELEKICITSPGHTPPSPKLIFSDLLNINDSSPVTPPPTPLYSSPAPALPVSVSTSPHLECQPFKSQTVLSLKDSKCASNSTNHSDTDYSLDENTQSINYIPKPLITAQALQMVQLRPVQKLDRLNTDQEWSCLQQEEKAKKSEAVNILPVLSNGIQKSSPPVIQSLQDFAKTSNLSEDTLDGFLINGQAEHLKPLEMTPIQTDVPEKPPAHEEESDSLQVPMIEQKFSSSCKNPKLTLTLPPVPPLLVTESNGPQVLSPGKLSVLEPIERFPLLEGEDNHKDDEKDEDSRSLPPLARQEDCQGSQQSSENCPVRELDLTIKEQEFTACDERITSDGDGDSASSTTDSFSSKDEDDGEAFESIVSSPDSEINAGVPEYMVSPARPRTTEDLFAAIHRSKRKVLGWKESEEDRSRAHSSSPPITPTGLAPRQTTCIQRGIRKTATSSDSFKALLLKKGSRSESGFRMSAAELLKSTDPRHYRAQSDSNPDPPPPAPGSPCTSPGRGRRASEEWARTEGPLPRFSPVFVGSRHGRSRTPPSAASSRYNARNRILSSPMTAISEREGELGEAEDCCGVPESRTLTGIPPSPVSMPQAYSGTLCEDNC